MRCIECKFTAVAAEAVSCHVFGGVDFDFSASWQLWFGMAVMALDVSMKSLGIMCS